MVWERAGEPILVIADRYRTDMIDHTHSKIKDRMTGIMIEKQRIERRAKGTARRSKAF
jgi:phenylalanyl-tRNA synthetase alpha subunit